jgi:acyl carrier protein
MAAWRCSEGRLCIRGGEKGLRPDVPVVKRPLTSALRGVTNFSALGEACMSEVFERVKAIVIKHLEAPPEKVVEKASFIDDLGADSLDNVELVMAFEEEFGIEIPDDAAEHIQTVGDAVKFISEKQG